MTLVILKYSGILDTGRFHGNCATTREEIMNSGVYFDRTVQKEKKNISFSGTELRVEGKLYDAFLVN